MRWRLPPFAGLQAIRIITPQCEWCLLERKGTGTPWRCAVWQPCLRAEWWLPIRHAIQNYSKVCWLFYFFPCKPLFWNGQNVLCEFLQELTSANTWEMSASPWSSQPTHIRGLPALSTGKSRGHIPPQYSKRIARAGWGNSSVRENLSYL